MISLSKCFVDRAALGVRLGGLRLDLPIRSPPEPGNGTEELSRFQVMLLKELFGCGVVAQINSKGGIRAERRSWTNDIGLLKRFERVGIAVKTNFAPASSSRWFFNSSSARVTPAKPYDLPALRARSASFAPTKPGPEPWRKKSHDSNAASCSIFLRRPPTSGSDQSAAFRPLPKVRSAKGSPCRWDDAFRAG